VLQNENEKGEGPSTLKKLQGISQMKIPLQAFWEVTTAAQGDGINFRPETVSLQFTPKWWVPEDKEK